MTWMATQMVTRSATMAILARRLIVFHFSLCEHPCRRGDCVEGDRSNSRAVYLMSEDLKRPARFWIDLTRGRIFGSDTIVNSEDDGRLERMLNVIDFYISRKRNNSDGYKLKQVPNVTSKVRCRSVPRYVGAMRLKRAL